MLVKAALAGFMLLSSLPAVRCFYALQLPHTEPQGEIRPQDNSDSAGLDEDQLCD